MWALLSVVRACSYTPPATRVHMVANMVEAFKSKLCVSSEWPEIAALQYS